MTAAQQITLGQTFQQNARPSPKESQTPNPPKALVSYIRRCVAEAETSKRQGQGLSQHPPSSPPPATAEELTVWENEGLWDTIAQHTASDRLEDTIQQI